MFPWLKLYFTMILINIINTIHKRLKLSLDGGFNIKLRIIILISALTCIFVSGCSTPAEEKVKSLDDAYFYIIDKKDDMKIDDVKNLLKDYKLDIVDNSEVHDVEGEKSYGYRFGNDETFLNVGFIVSGNNETIDFLEYHLDNDKLLLMSSKEENQWVYSIAHSQLDATTPKKILKEVNELGLSIEKKENQYSLEDAYYKIMNSLSNSEDMQINDVKKLLKGYSLESDLVEDEPEDDLKMYSYEFSNDNNESITVTNTIQDNKEYISDINYFIGSLKNYPYLSISSLSGDPGVFIDYYTNDKTTYEKAYNLINKSK